MSDTRFRDFDAAFAEDDSGAPQPLAMQLFGERWELPADPPARDMLLRKRMAAAARAGYMAQLLVQDGKEEQAVKLLKPYADDPEIQTYDLWKRAASLVGKDNLDAWMAHEPPIGYHMLRRVVEWVEDQHDMRTPSPANQGDEEDDEDEKDGGDNPEEGPPSGGE